MTMFTRRTQFAIAALTLVTLSACQDTSEHAPITTTTPAGDVTTAPTAAAAERADHALVRFVHAVPTGPRVDLYADDARTFDAADYKSVTPYREVDGQRYTLRLRPAGVAQGRPLATNSEGLDDGDYYTVFAVPNERGVATLRVVKDDFSRPSQGRARVRVVHAAGDLSELDVYVTGSTDELFDGVDFQSVTDYDEIDPWSGTLEIRAEDGSTALATVTDVAFAAGKVYTVVIAGRVKGTPKLEAFVIEDHIGTSAN